MTLNAIPLPDPVKTDPKEWISPKLYVASLYFITVGVLYLWGYWPSFGINILEYLDLTDILKVTAYPIAITVLLVVGTSSAADFFFKKHEYRIDAVLQIPPSGLSDVERAAWLTRTAPRRRQMERNLKRFKVSLWILAGFLLASDWQQKWVVLPAVVVAPAASLLAHHEFFRKRVDDINSRFTLVFVLLGVLLYSYGSGKTNANNIIDGISYRYVISDFADMKKSESPSSLRYVGHAGEYLFFFDSSRKATVISKLEDDKPLVLKEYKVTYRYMTMKELAAMLRSFITSASNMLDR